MYTPTVDTMPFKKITSVEHLEANVVSLKEELPSVKYMQCVGAKNSHAFHKYFHILFNFCDPKFEYIRVFLSMYKNETKYLFVDTVSFITWRRTDKGKWTNPGVVESGRKSNMRPFGLTG